MNPSRFALVIFDCDGVLVDSELITNRIFASMLNELGIPVTLDDMFEQFVGRSMATCLEKIAGLLGRPVPEDFVHQYHARTNAALRSGLKAVPDIDTVLDEINVPYCVASSGSHEKMQTTLGVTGLLPRFQNKIFSVTDVARGKPFPDVFLYAANKLGFAPSNCAVVEDSPAGVAAGVAAGMTVYGYCALMPQHRLQEAGAHYTFDNMRELPRLLSEAQ
jgi:HAD superfamily hydrolase (TIGR01509 family)